MRSGQVRHLAARGPHDVKTPQLSWADRAILVALARLLPRSQLRQLHLNHLPASLAALARQPEPCGTGPARTALPGGPGPAPAIRALVLEMARGNPAWG